MIRQLAVFALLCSLAPAVASAAEVSFEYDRNVPLEFTTEDTELVEGGVRLDEVTYRSGNATIHAALVHPQDDGNAMPGVLFVHALGDAVTSNRSEFVADAEWLARRGVVSLVPEQPWSDPSWTLRASAPGQAERNSIAEVVALRRGLDLLIATPGVDPRAIAYVGHDLGAQYGALVASVDTRVAYYVFITPALTPAPVLGTLDLAAAVARTNPRACLVQIAARDRLVSKAQSNAFVAALAATGRTVTTYDDGHALTSDAAADDRRAWLVARFGL